MKLIDANELVKAIENENPGLSISGAIEKFARIAQVNMQPTVKAIPYGFISEYSRRPISNADYWAIMRMVTAWEKENADTD